MVALSTDIDLTGIDSFRETHRFMNTLAITSMGVGVGLDVSNSFWLYERGSPCKFRTELAYFADKSGDRPSAHAEELISYVKCGWIDTLHTYGDFSETEQLGIQFTRAHAEKAMEVLDRHQLQFRVWTNHGDRSNKQNIGEHPHCLGDVAGSIAYHADLLRFHGIEFMWRAGRSDRLGGPSLIEKHELRDGTPVFSFRRFHARRDLPNAHRVGLLNNLRPGLDRTGTPFLLVWQPQGLEYQISDEILWSIVSRGHMCVFGQHLGAINPLVGYDPFMISRFRSLAEFQEAGHLLVARTSRLLQYDRIRKQITYEVRSLSDRLIIDIGVVLDHTRGEWIPTLDDLRGLTFYCENPYTAAIWLGGAAICNCEIVRSGTDGVAPSIGIRWFKPDLTDYASEFIKRDRSNFVIWNADASERTNRLNGDILSFLRSEQDRAEEPADAQKSKAAVAYSIGRYEIGLAHYTGLIEKIGFVEKKCGLDIGSGAGHWCMAFLQHSAEVVGVDPRREYIDLAKRVADQFGFGSRAEFRVQRGEGIQFSDRSFDCCWSHGVLMYANAELVISKIAGALGDFDPFYCGYTVAGSRLHGIHTALVEGNAEKVATQAGILVSAALYDCGVYHTRSSRVRMLNLDALLQICRAFGLRLAGRPDVQDGYPSYLGHVSTIDFVVRKEEDQLAVRQHLLERRPLGLDWFEDLEELSRSGCPSLVCDILRVCEVERDERVLDLWHRSLVRAGLGCTEEAVSIFESRAARRPSDLALGLYWHDRGRIARAAACYERVDRAHPDKAFLVGACYLHKSDWEAAALQFRSAIGGGSESVREWAGLIAASLKIGGLGMAVKVFRDFVESCRMRQAVGEAEIDFALAELEAARI